MFGKMKGELVVPPGAKTDPRSQELVRVWAAHGEQHVALRADAWGEDAAAWGVMLADLARHLARAHQQKYSHPEAQTLARIRQLLEAEWENPTDTPRGGFQANG